MHAATTQLYNQCRPTVSLHRSIGDPDAVKLKPCLLLPNKN
jgi:hypothetical protein